MKTFAFILSLFCISFSTGTTSKYVEDFEKGYKYVLDNQDQLASLSQDAFLAHIADHFGIAHSIRIRTLSEILDEGGNPWSQDLTAMLRDLNNNIANAQSFEDFLSALTTFENATGNLNSGERERALTYLRDLRDVMQLLYHSLQFYNHHTDYASEMRGWWQNWGKCVAGILGGVGSGALAGAAIGGAATVGIGAIPGGVVGAISGGLTSAANFC